VTDFLAQVQAWSMLVESGDAELTMEISDMTGRTNKQNNSLHKGLQNLADEFNAGGLDMRKVLKPGVDIPWTKESAKEYLFNPISMVMYDGRTSSELDTTEMQEVWKVLMRFTGEKHGVTVDWPSEESLSESQRASE